MTNREKYNNIFFRTFKGIEEKDLENLKYRGIPHWDSVGHMELVSELEEAFDVHLTTLEVLEFSSYQIGIELLEKYGVTV